MQGFFSMMYFKIYFWNNLSYPLDFKNLKARLVHDSFRALSYCRRDNDGSDLGPKESISVTRRHTHCVIEPWEHSLQISRFLLNILKRLSLHRIYEFAV